ncbi:hypothetical protein M433DRAFT_274294 [Acidomyces richmondensis BFW]|nr:hypothetical protein M433DRAFT_274294 [Acidomyces richmondensis BFW]
MKSPSPPKNRTILLNPHSARPSNILTHGGTQRPPYCHFAPYRHVPRPTTLRYSPPSLQLVHNRNIHSSRDVLQPPFGNDPVPPVFHVSSAIRNAVGSRPRRRRQGVLLLPWCYGGRKSESKLCEETCSGV